MTTIKVKQQKSFRAFLAEKEREVEDTRNLFLMEEKFCIFYYAINCPHRFNPYLPL